MYRKTEWKDHVVAPENTFKVERLSDDVIKLSPIGTVLQQGTNMSAANFNHMEQGIAEATHDIERLNNISGAVSVSTSSPTIKSDMKIAVDTGSGMQQISLADLIHLIFNECIHISGNRELLRINGDTHAYVTAFVDGVRRAWIGFGDTYSQFLKIVNEYCNKQLAITPDGNLTFNGVADFQGLKLAGKNVEKIGDLVNSTIDGSFAPIGLNGNLWAEHRNMTLSAGTWIIDCGYTAKDQAGKYLDYAMSGVNVDIAGVLYCPDNFEHSSTASAVVTLDKKTTIRLRAWSSNGMTAVNRHYLHATKLVD